MFGEGQEIQRRLERLYPGESGVKKYREYRNKQKRLAVLMMLFGMGIGVAGCLSGQIQSKMQEEGSLPRNEWGEGSYQVTLSAEVGEITERITYVVEERQYTDEELTHLSLVAIEALEKEIAGENESLLCIRNHLTLPTQLSGYPFAISWKSSDYQKLRPDGVIAMEEIPAQGEEVMLTATLTCQEKVFRKEFRIRLYPKLMSKEEQQEKELMQLISESDNRSKQQDNIRLPTMLGNDAIVWKEQADGRLIWSILLGMAGAAALIWGMNRDLAKKDAKRRAELADLYPEFVSCLQLYLGAGLSLRNAFFKIGSNYRKQKRRDGKTSYLYEEVDMACNQLTNGVAECEVYRKWAKRCDEIHYRKLGYLLVSYNRQGNVDIVRQLEKEVYAAWEERRNSVRKQGEEAETKLLFPMILMLLVVMLLIMLPVYVSF